MQTKSSTTVAANVAVVVYAAKNDSSFAVRTEI